MKRIAFLMVTALVFCGNVSAQDKEIKHEIAISMGGMSNSNWIDAFENIGGAMVGMKFDGDKFIGPLSAEYFYHLDPKCSVGAIFCFGNLTQDVYIKSKNDPKDGKATNTYFSVLPAVKYDWVSKEHFGLYSKAGAGITYRSEKLDYNAAAESRGYKDHNDSEIHFNWHVSLIGIEAGSRNLRGFLELGVGEQGMAQVGLRCKF